MGTTTGVYQGLVSAIADTIYEAGGWLLTRTSAVYTAGGGSLPVDGTHRWPDAGRIAVGGMTATYASKTNTTLDGLVDSDGNPGLPSDVRAGSTVMDISRSRTQLDDLRAAFFVETAVEDQLDSLARNYGIHRPRGLDDATFRELLKVMIYLDAQTLRACRKVLDVLQGVGNYELFEDLESDPLTVHVVIPPSVGTDPSGKTYLVSGEEQPSTGVFTVDVDHPPTRVYGIYDDGDPYRLGTNFAMETISGFTDASDPDRFFSPVAAFLPSDENQPIVIGVEAWKIIAYLDPVTIQLGSHERDDGAVNTGAPDEFTTDTDWWRPWMVGHNVIVEAVNVGNSGTYEIAEYLSPFSVRLTGAAFTTETNISWRLSPNFSSVNPVSADILRATASGNTITAPNALPANVLVDYTTIDSAQLMESPNESGGDASPFFLVDDGNTVRTTLDLITAAGVRVVVDVE